MNITFPDGSVRQYDDGINAAAIAESISPRLKKAALAAELDGKLYDLRMPIDSDHELKILTFADDGGKWTYRHTAAHMLAQAVKRLYPDVMEVERILLFGFSIKTCGCVPHLQCRRLV